MCIGYQLVQRNAPRVIWSLIAAAVFPRDNFLEVRLLRSSRCESFGVLNESCSFPDDCHRLQYLGI